MRVEFNKETELLKKNQTKIQLEEKNLGRHTKTAQVSLTKDIKETISGQKKWIAQSNKMLNLKKKIQTQTSRKSETL